MTMLNTLPPISCCYISRYITYYNIYHSSLLTPYYRSVPLRCHSTLDSYKLFQLCFHLINLLIPLYVYNTSMIQCTYILLHLPVVCLITTIQRYINIVLMLRVPDTSDLLRTKIYSIASSICLFHNLSTTVTIFYISFQSFQL